jgi:hypothetical protein
MFSELVTPHTRINKLQLIPIIYNASEGQFKIITKLNKDGVNDRLYESSNSYVTFENVTSKNLFDMVSKLFHDILAHVPNPKYIIDINVEPTVNMLTLYYFLPKFDESSIKKSPEYNRVLTSNISNSASVSTELHNMRFNILKAIALSKSRNNLI